MMPRAVVVRERTSYLSEDVRSNRLIERGAESTIREDAQLPRTAASLNAGVVGRWVRRPVEPRGDGEIHPGNLNCGSRDSVSHVELPRTTDIADDVRRASQCPRAALARKVLHQSIRMQGLHVIRQGEAIAARGRRW